MDAHKKGVQEIFTNSRQLIVPFYQRSYVWKEDQWERFVKDMEYITEVKKDYFFGSVILKQQHTNTDVITDKRTIIDGQ